MDWEHSLQSAADSAVACWRLSTERHRTARNFQLRTFHKAPAPPPTELSTTFSKLTECVRRLASYSHETRRKMATAAEPFPHVHTINPLAPNDIYYVSRTAQLTSRRCILNIYSTNILTEYFKHAAHSPFLFLFKMPFIS